MARVFVSYAADADVGQAERIAADLRAAGVDVWMAPGSIGPGESFSGAIDRGLEQSDYFLVLLSPASLASRWVQIEVHAAIDRAQANKIKILPLLLSPVAVPPLLSTFQQIDLIDYERGIQVLGGTLGVPVSSVSAAAESRPPPPGARDRRPPPDAFAATALGALSSGSRYSGYLVQQTEPTPGSIIDAIVEVALLRVGVAIWPSDTSKGRVLALVEQELSTNLHRVAAVLAICHGESTALDQHRLLGATSPNAVLLTWNPADGADAVGMAIPLLVELVSGRGPAPE
jgi:TIR domain